ncbi:hypothetical protein P4E94_10940 [Pontiellaceae bacterium B12219]|nr:hypothetical protein [Pontiellaceae bacterium B12219]
MRSLLKKLTLPLLLLTGCSTYQPATVKDGVISNPSVGWNGYTIDIPKGVGPLKAENGVSAQERQHKIRTWYDDQRSNDMLDFGTLTYNQLLYENPAQTYVLSFICESYDLRAGWGVMTSVEKQFIIQKLINRKLVIINDTKAHSEQIEINGQRGWYISGNSKPYFTKNPTTLAYEGIFLLGDLKEAFWIECFGQEGERASMKQCVYEMADSLDVKK